MVPKNDPGNEMINEKIAMDIVNYGDPSEQLLKELQLKPSEGPWMMFLVVRKFKLTVLLTNKHEYLYDAIPTSKIGKPIN